MHISSSYGSIPLSWVAQMPVEYNVNDESGAFTVYDFIWMSSLPGVSFLTLSRSDACKIQCKRWVQAICMDELRHQESLRCREHTMQTTELGTSSGSAWPLWTAQMRAILRHSYRLFLWVSLVTLSCCRTHLQPSRDYQEPTKAAFNFEHPLRRVNFLFMRGCGGEAETDEGMVNCRSRLYYKAYTRYIYIYIYIYIYQFA